MGTDPSTDDYSEGDECALCVDLLFDGLTPKYVEAFITGIDKCPISPWEPPTGTALLTQIQPCVWTGLIGVSQIQWVLQPGQSILKIFPNVFWSFFNSIVADDCIDAFVNQNVCGVGGSYGENGYVLLYWGPTIGP